MTMPNNIPFKNVRPFQGRYTLLHQRPGYEFLKKLLASVFPEVKEVCTIQKTKVKYQQSNC